VVSLFSGADLLAHAACYGILCLLLARSLVPPRVTTWQRVFLLTALVTAYGITDEFHQLFVPGRFASGWDILADSAGGFLAALLLFWRDRAALKILQHQLSGEKEFATCAMTRSFPMDGGKR
jgi:VanZ family protein